MPHELRHDTFLFSDNRSLLDMNVIHGFLSTCYWSHSIPRPLLEKAITNSLPFGRLRHRHFRAGRFRPEGYLRLRHIRLRRRRLHPGVPPRPRPLQTPHAPHPRAPRPPKASAASASSPKTPRASTKSAASPTSKTRQRSFICRSTSETSTARPPHSCRLDALMPDAWMPSSTRNPPDP